MGHSQFQSGTVCTLVDRVSQVVTPKGLALVRTWLRRLRRSLRAAQRGELKMAKRLRPQDLWLGEEYMVLEARDWNLDLRARWQSASRQFRWHLQVVMVWSHPRSSFDRSELGKDDSTFADQAIFFRRRLKACVMTARAGAGAYCAHRTDLRLKTLQ